MQYNICFCKYGRKDIESAQKHKNPEKNDDDDEGYSEEICVPDRLSETTSKIKAIFPPNGLKNGMANGGNNLISRDDKLILVPEPPTYPPKEEEKLSYDELKDGNNKEKYKDFDLATVFDYLKVGVEAIIEDDVTSRFEAEELKNWNLLIRTNRGYEFISWKLTIIWMCGFFIRYFFLIPFESNYLFCWGYMPDNGYKRWLNRRFYMIAFRIISRSLSGTIRIHNKQWRPAKGSVCVANHTSPYDVVILSVDNCYSLVWWLTLCTALVGYVKPSDFKQRLNRYVSIMCFGILSRAISSVVTYHNEENKPKNGICVANHTSPIDVLILMCDNCYSLIGQRHGGFLGLLQRALARASPHIWFERSEVRDRHAVARSFEVGSIIYPVAIKYDPRFGDAFWNSNRYSMLQYLYMMMTSWAIVCDVWYLPPMHQNEGETAIDFANRVKSVVAKQGGLVDLVWDGQLKRVKAKKEWRERQQEEFSKRLKVE
ncbi:hypothetical protein NQ314_001019 [Rhamnusium bicolor]|uniref:Phospholipid/glycerol acyltransferase domain-containing protein n=1 Tax=Rhamnusium bicolor TaxID=1586634 RepID=A0AAV8ZVI9_9CUCU|nr:hypothetical protein NQ314_001019 [Rhamnusium bicolor]